MATATLTRNRSEGFQRPASGLPSRQTAEKYLSVAEVAERLGTTERFPRRLIEERRIEFKRFGKHVRIAESTLMTYIDSCTVEPIQGRRTR